MPPRIGPSQRTPCERCGVGVVRGGRNKNLERLVCRDCIEVDPEYALGLVVFKQLLPS